MIGDLHLGQVQALADMAGPWGVHDHSPEAGGGIHLQLGDGHQPGPVLIAPGKVADQVGQRVDIQSFKLLCLGRADALEYGDRIRQSGHGGHLLS